MATLPIANVTLPKDLKGQNNGDLDPALLVKIGAPGRPNAQLHHLAARAYRALISEMERLFPVTITVTSTADALRTLRVQQITWDLRYVPNSQMVSAGGTVPDEDVNKAKGKYRDGQWWWLRRGMAMAAWPGESNHGWGLAADICYWVDDTIIGITTNPKAFAWLLANARRFGFSWEAQSEPWHIRYVTGDAIPAAVIAWEQAQVPPPPPLPPLEEDDMKHIIGIDNGIESRGPALVGAGFYHGRENDQEAFLMRETYGPPVELNGDQYDLFVRMHLSDNAANPGFGYRKA